jgi:hypothetical protein
MVGLMVAVSAGVAMALPTPIASTGFETSEGYTTGQVRGQPGNSFPMPDGPGWGNNNWTGEGTSKDGVIFTPIVSDASAREGSQYLMIHGNVAPSTGDNRLRRKYDTSLIQDNRVALGASIRLDTDQAAYDANDKWFASHFNVYLEYGTSSPNPNEGKQNIRIEFARDNGNVNLKTPSGSVVLGQWTDPASKVFAKDAWLDVLFDVDIAASKFDVYMNGVNMGNYDFNKTLGAGEILNQIRFQGPRAYTGFLNTGASIDNVSLTTVPEPACALGLVLAGGVMALRRRSRC